MAQYGLSRYDATVLTASFELADFYELTVKSAGGEAKLAANWVTSELLGLLNKDGLELAQSPVSAPMLGQMLARIIDNTISGKIAKQVFEAMWNREGTADDVIAKRGLKQVTDAGAIEKVIDGVIEQNPDQVAQYRAGKDKLFGFFVGQVMKLSQGKANPAQVNELLKKKLAG